VKIPLEVMGLGVITFPLGSVTCHVASVLSGVAELSKYTLKPCASEKYSAANVGLMEVKTGDDGCVMLI